MIRLDRFEEEELLNPLRVDQTNSEPWQPITTLYHDASDYERSSYPVCSDGGRKPDQADEYRDEYTDEAGEYFDDEEPPGYYNQHGQRYGFSEDDEEMLVPPAEDYRRPRWDMSSNPYRTPQFYDDSRQHSMPQGYPQHPQQLSANTSTNSNNVVLVQPGSSHSQTVSTEHIDDYTALSWFTLCFCCMPLGIAALIKASDSQKSLRLGRRQEALEQAHSSRNLNVAAITIGPLITLAIILLRLFVFHH